MTQADDELLSGMDRAAWRRWLRKNSGRPTGVWLAVAKKGRGSSGVTYEEAVEEALCFGWIDSKANALDEDRYKQWMAPRKPMSAWSTSNKRRVEQLIATKRMTRAGLAAIETAKRNGSWDALTGSDALVVPDDLAAALDGAARAREHWDAFPPGARKQILAWINSAKRPATREKRVAETAELAARNERANRSS